MMVNVDVSATAFYESGPLPQMVVKILNWRSIDDLRRGINDRDRVKLEKVLRSLKIKVVHRGENNRRYKISKLTSTPADQTLFKIGDSEEKQDVASYFNKTYGKKLSFPFLPCVVVQNSTFLPMEVCEVVPVCVSSLVLGVHRYFTLYIILMTMILLSGTTPHEETQRKADRRNDQVYLPKA
jgi:hypothetical protein